MNTAAELAEAGLPAAEAARVLAARSVEDFLAQLRGQAATATVAERQRVLRLLVKIGA